MEKNGSEGVAVVLAGGRPADPAQPWGRLLLRIALIALAIYFFWRVRGILTTLVGALVLASAALPLVDLLTRRRWGKMKPHLQRTLATAASFLIILTVLGFTVAWLISPFQTEFKKLVINLPTYQQQIQDQVLQVRNWYGGLPAEVRNVLDGARPHPGTGGEGAGAVQGYLRDVLQHTFAWASHLVETFLVPVLAFYFVLDGKSLRNQFVGLLPRRNQRQALAIFSEGGEIMRAYIVAQVSLAAIAGLLTYVILKFVIGMEYALVLALFAGLTRAIPVIGPFVGGVPVTLLAMVHGAQHGNPYLWIWVAVGFGLLHVIESKLLMPMFLGHALNIHAVVILIALLIGGEFFGLMGMFLAAPVAALIRLLLLHYYIVPRSRAAFATRESHRHGDHAPPDAPQRRGDGPHILTLERAMRHRRVAATPTVPTAIVVAEPADPVVVLAPAAIASTEKAPPLQPVSYAMPDPDGERLPPHHEPAPPAEPTGGAPNITPQGNAQT